MSPSPTRAYNEIRDGYLRYYETAFWLRDSGLRAERRRLLESPGVIFTDPLDEPVMPYDPGPTIQLRLTPVGSNPPPPSTIQGEDGTMLAPQAVMVSPEAVSTGNSRASFPVRASQTFTFVPQWLPVATRRPSGLTSI